LELVVTWLLAMLPIGLVYWLVALARNGNGSKGFWLAFTVERSLTFGESCREMASRTPP
jgi:hypothetical protein